MEDLLTDEDLHELEDELLADPRRGTTIPGTGGFRKLRVAAEGRGKRGGARVVYYYVDRRGTIYLITAYPKSDQEDLTEAEKRALRSIARRLE